MPETTSLHCNIGSQPRLGMRLNNVENFSRNGLATKADHAAALRGYHNAVEEMSSPDRAEAKSLGLDEI